MTYTTHADLGGQSGHGRVVPQPHGDLFHAAWEPRVLALTLAAGATGAWNIDMSRAARETLPDYARSSYYLIWLNALVKLLAERGMVQPDELAAARMLHDGPAVPHVLHAQHVSSALARGSPTLRAAVHTARFEVGDAVRAKPGPFPHHTRLPAYVRGRLGVVERLQGCHVFADAHAQGLGEQPQWLYSVAFEGFELWGADAAPGSSVSVDAWEAYLDTA